MSLCAEQPMGVAWNVSLFSAKLGCLRTGKVLIALPEKAEEETKKGRPLTLVSITLQTLTDFANDL